MEPKESAWKDVVIPMKVNLDGSLPGDHDSDPDYDIITRAIEAIPAGKIGMTCEIGLRKGGTSGYIMDALAKGIFPYKVHVAVDPFGNIVYAEREGLDRKLNYTNQMRDKYIGPIYLYAMEREINFIFLNLEDTEFFDRYGDGVPVYSENKHILNEYIFAHIDGPHQYFPVRNEFHWFDDRMSSGATIVFDDIASYDHEVLEAEILVRGWKLLEKHTEPYDGKASYQKI